MYNGTNSVLYGFEDYKLISIRPWCLQSTYSTQLPEKYLCGSPIFMTADIITHKLENGSWNEKVLKYSDMKDKLHDGCKLYVHPACKLSRSLLAEKYKRCLNPWVADAVVLPDPVVPVYSDTVMLFSNDEEKLIIMVLGVESYKETFEYMKEGDSFLSAYKIQPQPNSFMSLETARNSKLFYKGDIFNFNNSNMYVFDIITHKIPNDRTVSEKTVQKSLSTEDNKITLEVLLNIADMLDSSDYNTVGAGLKALSMLDYTHYTESIRYVLYNLNNSMYKYNKAANSTSVKFMFSQITGSTRKNRWPGYYGRDIYPQDYELFTQLVNHYNSSADEDVRKDIIKSLSFTTFNIEGVLVPRVRE